MSAPILLTGTRLGNRYVVKSVASFERGRPSYFVRDEGDGGDTRVVRETLLSGLDPHDRKQRRDLFLEAAAAVLNLEHPHACRVRDVFVEGNRAYVVMDRVEGVTLSTILQMGSHGVREASVLRWGTELAEALAWLHGRTPPFVFGEIRPEDVIVTPRDHVVLLDFGLGRFFGPRAPHSAISGDAADRLADQVALAALLETLLLGHVPEEGAHPATLHPATHAALERLRGAPSFPSMDDAASSLHEVLALVAPAAVEEDVALVLLDAPQEPTLQRPLRRLLAAVALLSVVAGLWAALSPVRRLEGAPERLWILDGANVVRAVTLDGRSEGSPRRLPDSRITEMRYVSRLGLLVLADGLHPRLLLVTPDGSPLACALAAPARCLLLSPDQRMLYCVEGDGVVAQIALTPGRRVQGWNLGGRLTALAVSRDGRRLYASDTGRSRLHTIDLEGGRIAGNEALAGGPGPLAADPDGHALWVALEDLGRLALVDLRTDGTPVGNPRLIEGLHDAIADVRFTPDGRSVYVLCRESRRLAVVDATSRALVRYVDILAWRPRAWAFSLNPARAYVIAEGASGVAIIDAESHRYERAVNLGGQPRAVEFAR